MSNINRPGGRRILILALIGLGLAAAAPVAPMLWSAFASGKFQLHAPDWALFAAQRSAVQIHVVAALSALGIGVGIWLLPKGVGPHKALGWTWVAAMTVTAVSSLFITGLNGGFYSIIHLLTGWVLVALPMAIFAIRRKDVRTHSRTMAAIFIGGLIVAGAFTFIPGRFMFNFLFG